MVIRYMRRIKSKRILDGILELLTLCDGEFVPPLSSRSSTTQRELTDTGERGAAPYAYFESIREQSALVALEGGRVLGVMSFRKDYVSQEIPRETQPNLYVTTVAIHPKRQGEGIAGALYDKLIDRFVGYHIFTRTWSTNSGHISLLRSRKFYERHRLVDDRGQGIDTVFFCHDPLNKTRRQIVQQYRLTGSFIFLALLVLLSIVFLAVWLMTEHGVCHELSLACFTSMMASLLCLGSELFLKYRESKNDEYIQTLKSFGIEDLQFHKDELLERLIPKCSKEVWISGYRLIMTAKQPFLDALRAACGKRRGLRVRLLTVAPWSEAFWQVYGDADERVADNYLAVFSTLCLCTRDLGCDLVIRMTEKPIFSDTYKVDDRFITGPYLHCNDKEDEKITAKDFFSLDINDPEKTLYELIYKDYTAVWNAASFEFDHVGFARDYREREEEIGKLNARDKFAFLKKYLRGSSADGDLN